MYCNKCGAHINDEDMFCGECGAKVEISDNNPNMTENESSGESVVFDAYAHTEEIIPEESAEEAHQELEDNNENQTGKKSNNIKISIKKKTAKTILLIALAVVVLITALVVGIKIHNDKVLKAPITISLNDYITDKYLTIEEMNAFYEDNESFEEDLNFSQDDGYYDEEADIYYVYTYRNGIYGVALPVYGYNGYGYVDEYGLCNIIDWESFYSDLNALIAEKKGYENQTYRDFLNGNDFTFTIDKKEDISNGDKLTVSVKAVNDTYTHGDVTIKISQASQSYDITTLKEVTTVDPFDYVELYTYGANHYASAAPVVDENLNKKIDGTKDISVRAYDNDMAAIYKGDYIIAKIEYFVDDDADYISNGDEVKMYCSCEEAESLVNDYNLYIAKTNYTYTINNLGDYINKDFAITDDDLKKFKKDANDRVNDYFAGNDSYSNISFSCAYLSDLKDKTDESSSIKNILYIVYSYNYTNWYDEVETKYYCVEYADIIAFDGKVKFSVADYYNDYNYGDSVEELVTNNRISEYYNFKKL